MPSAYILSLIHIYPEQLVRLEGYTVRVREKPAGEYRVSEFQIT